MIFLITIAGLAGSGKTRVAQGRFKMYTENPTAHVFMLDDGEVKSSRPHLPIYLADALIRTTVANRGICEFHEHVTLIPTNWFPPGIKPERPGVYEVESVLNGQWFAYFDGKRWGCMTTKGPEAAVQRYKENPGTRYVSLPWRGLAADPWSVA